MNTETLTFPAKPCLESLVSNNNKVNQNQTNTDTLLFAKLLKVKAQTNPDSMKALVKKTGSLKGIKNSLNQILQLLNVKLSDPSISKESKDELQKLAVLFKNMDAKSNDVNPDLPSQLLEVSNALSELKKTPQNGTALEEHVQKLLDVFQKNLSEALSSDVSKPLNNKQNHLSINKPIIVKGTDTDKVKTNVISKLSSKLDTMIGNLEQLLKGDNAKTPLKNDSVKQDIQSLLGLLKEIRNQISDSGDVKDKKVFLQLLDKLEDTQKPLLNQQEIKKIATFQEKAKKDNYNDVSWLAPIMTWITNQIQDNEQKNTKDLRVSSKGLVNKIGTDNLIKPKPDVKVPANVQKDTPKIVKPTVNPTSNLAKVELVESHKKDKGSNDLKPIASTNHWFSSGPMNRIHQLELHSKGQTPSPNAQIVEQIKAVLEKGGLKQLPDGGLQLTVRLHPDNLGTVQVVMMQTSTGLEATILAHSQTAKDMIQSQINQLHQSLGALGLNVQKIDVQQFNMPGQSLQGQNYQDPNGQGRQQEQQHHSPNSTDIIEDEMDTSFEEWLKEGGITWV